jgi:hypothetical protein
MRESSNPAAARRMAVKLTSGRPAQAGIDGKSIGFRLDALRAAGCDAVHEDRLSGVVAILKHSTWRTGCLRRASGPATAYERDQSSQTAHAAHC